MGDKFIKYSVIGARSCNTGVFCPICHAEVRDRVENELIACPLCTMGLADGEESKKKERVRKMSVKNWRGNE